MNTDIVYVRPDGIMESTGPDTTAYVIVHAHDDRLARAFRVGPMNGQTVDEVAEANLGQWSREHWGGYLLFRDTLLVAHAESGVIRSLRPDNPALVRTGREAA